MRVGRQFLHWYGSWKTCVLLSLREGLITIAVVEIIISVIKTVTGNDFLTIFNYLASAKIQEPLHSYLVTIGMFGSGLQLVTGTIGMLAVVFKDPPMVIAFFWMEVFKATIFLCGESIQYTMHNVVIKE